MKEVIDGRRGVRQKIDQENHLFGKENSVMVAAITESYKLTLNLY